MPVHPESVETQAVILAGWLGSARGSTAPSQYQVEAWIDNPLEDGAQQADFGGYTPAVLSSNGWTVDTAAGEVATTAVVSLGTPTTTGTDALRYWALRNTTSGDLAFSAPLARPARPVVGVAVQIRPLIRFATGN